jgi:MFS family permease
MSAASIIAASAGGIALGTLGVELFPTETRSTSNGLLGVIGVLGSVVGFLLTGALAHPQGELGRAIAICGIGSLFAAIVLVPLLPESGSHELDDVSPTGARPPDEYGLDA